jgi:hypothetical protein
MLIDGYKFIGLIAVVIASVAFTITLITSIKWVFS